ncbi:MAG TPA: GspE/PulE family protein [Patescibacteria group bacterium]|jgi:type IV pilus assembly protein PilB|nr:GspE/PulE family protein [Patescibacteria group bacterium]
MSNFLSSNPKDLSRALEDEKRDIEERESQGRANSLGMQYVNLQNFPLDLTALSIITEQEAREIGAVPFYKERHDVRMGTNDPTNPALKAKIAEMSTKFKVELYYISLSSYESTMKFYSKVIRPTSTFENAIKFGDSGTQDELQELMQNRATNASDLLTAMFGAAVSQGSSDIHLEPEEHMVKVRLRIDGVLHDAAQMPKESHNSVVSRIKLLAKLKLNVTNVSQDGRFTVMHNNEPLDVRVSILPSSYGEAIVMRLLGIGAVDVSVKDLMIQGRAGEVVIEQLDKPNGMILTTGPTGSGKTTTLYAFLRELNKPGVKIITLEDPVEYKVEGIQQTPIDHRVDFNFAKGLRAVLRQDPDIVMVGEIRDPETAETALQAALTGHIVLSTLHTNDAAGAVPRLVTMGVKPFTIAPALNAVLAQRLVRRICQACIKPVELQPALLEKVEKLLNEIPANAKVEVPRGADGKLAFYHSEGCKECGGLGYKGRMGVYEVMEINDEMRELILKESSIIEIKKLAHTNGTMTMAQDGLLKALAKITDVEEVFRVVG